LRRFEVKFQGFRQVGERFFFRHALAGDIDLQTLRDQPFPLTPNSRGEWSLHEPILS
jgi:hypothetical protein